MDFVRSSSLVDTVQDLENLTMLTAYISIKLSYLRVILGAIDIFPLVM